jgi:hypothetical protein
MPRAGRPQRRPQLGQAALPDRDGGHDGDPESRRETARVHGQPSLRRLVHHVHAEDVGQAHLADLKGKGEDALEVLGVTHHDHGPRLSGQQDVARDPLVFGEGNE